MQRITAAQFRNGGKKGTKRVKNAKRVTVDGIEFHSKRESQRYLYLKSRQNAGEICKLELQVPYDLMGKSGPILTPTGRRMRSIIDFRYVDWSREGRTILEDSKGWQTEVSKIKLAILAAQGIHVDLV